MYLSYTVIQLAVIRRLFVAYTVHTFAHINVTLCDILKATKDNNEIRFSYRSTMNGKFIKQAMKDPLNMQMIQYI